MVPNIIRHRFSSVSHSFLTLHNHMNCSTADLPVHDQLLEFTQTHVHWVGDHLILCCPLILLPSIFPNIRVFSNESALHIRWPKYWTFSFNISPSNEHPGPISLRMDWLQSEGISRVFSKSSSALSFLYSPTLTSIHDCWKNHSLD